MKRYIVLFLGLLLLNSCAEKPVELQVLQGDAFGTTYTIQYFSNLDFEAEAGIDDVLYQVNKSVSTYLPNSDISRINNGDTTVVVNAIFREVYRISEKVYKESNGYFDPTVGVLRNAYGFGDEKPLAQIDSTTLDSLRQYVGFQKVSLRPNGTVKKTHPQIYFDFNAVAKGYGIDLLGSYLESQGVENYIIELGGEVLAKGTHLTKAKPWTAGVEATHSGLEERNIVATVALKNRAMAASGNYRKFRIDPETGKKYVHTINPLTGKAEESNVTSATVIARTCALADAYATTFMAMGLTASKRLVKELPDVEAYFTYINAKGQEKEFRTGGFFKASLN